MRRGSAYTAEEDATIRAMRAAGADWGEIAGALRRKRKSVYRRGLYIDAVGEMAEIDGPLCDGPVIRTVSGLTLDLSRRTATHGLSPEVRLEDAEARILEKLMRHPGVPLAYDRLIVAIYGDDWPESDVIKVQICKVRRKLRSIGADHLIETVWGFGYLFVKKLDTITRTFTPETWAALCAAHPELTGLAA